jgi:hypothetical protein
LPQVVGVQPLITGIDTLDLVFCFTSRVDVGSKGAKRILPEFVFPPMLEGLYVDFEVGIARTHQGFGLRNRAVGMVIGNLGALTFALLVNARERTFQTSPGKRRIAGLPSALSQPSS